MNNGHMSSMFEALMENIKAQEAKFIDFRITGIDGILRSITYSVDSLSKENYISGITANNSIWIPDLSTAFLDPFSTEKTIIILCNDSSSQDPRSILLRAMDLSSEIISNLLFEIDFHIFDDVRFQTSDLHSFVKIDSYEFMENNSKKYETSNTGYRASDPHMQSQPIDTLHDIRSEILLILSSIGIGMISHSHGNSPAQCRISYKEEDILMATDGLQIAKYVTKNIVNSYGKTVTFMPKPLIKSDGSGLNIEKTLEKTIAEHYIAGIKKHIKAINAFTNPTYGSYQRLNLEKQNINIRINKECKINLEFPDSSSNPYLMLSATIMAGIDGINNKLAHESVDYAFSIEDSISSLINDHEFLLHNGVFKKNFIEKYINIQHEKAKIYNQAVNNFTFELDYGC
jgi:glutamine synthetase